ncbi:hypothetical protein JOC37_002558 [Desulfohalotomaculum tongense]|uniref:hypothetical protein n=1 Tax=Desulforadius tongensis TaxID=1216062 RepID=UPI00195A2D80|nr:hypothetical protein [Desulforadius tongensis]MBM7856128.1 hypothetical protein [Desulforadius tongensis]
MKKNSKIILLILSLCIITFSYYNKEFNTLLNEQNFISKKTDNMTIKEEVKTVNSVSTTDINKYEGVYRYKNRHDTEDHYIVLEYVNGILQGRYYGTSDDFDDAREGYYVGFFVSDIKDLQIEGNAITFKLQLQDRDVFTKPIDLIYKSSQDIPLDKNPNWNIGLRKFSRDYKGEIINGEIQLETEFEKRVFKKLMTSRKY